MNPESTEPVHFIIKSVPTADKKSVTGTTEPLVITMKYSPVANVRTTSCGEPRRGGFTLPMASLRTLNSFPLVLAMTTDLQGIALIN